MLSHLNLTLRIKCMEVVKFSSGSKLGWVDLNIFFQIESRPIQKRIGCVKFLMVSSFLLANKFGAAGYPCHQYISILKRISMYGSAPSGH